MFWHSKCYLNTWRDFSESRHHTLKSGVFDFFGRAVALPLTRSTLVGRSYRVETPLFYFVQSYLFAVLSQKPLKTRTT